MRSIIRSVPFLVVLGALVVACTESTQTPVTPPKAGPTAPRHDYGASDVWNIADVEADFSGVYSLDTTQAGTSASPNISYDPETGDATFCRDHFDSVDLWWESDDGLMLFHLDPPVLFRSYRSGTFRSRAGLVFRKAVYETLQYKEASDPAGNVWRFHGRFNALCRGGELEIGPIVFGGQLVVPQDPIDRPVLVRRACNEDGGGIVQAVDYDPYGTGEPTTGTCTYGGSGEGAGSEGQGSGIQYEPGDSTGGETVDWNTGIGNGGNSSCGPLAVVEYVCIDVWDGDTWAKWACGYATTC